MIPSNVLLLSTLLVALLSTAAAERYVARRMSKAGKSHKDDGWDGGPWDWDGDSWDDGDLVLGRFGDVAYASGAQETPGSNGPIETTTTAKVMFDFDLAFAVMDYKIDIVSKVSSYDLCNNQCQIIHADMTSSIILCTLCRNMASKLPKCIFTAHRRVRTDPSSSIS